MSRLGTAAPGATEKVIEPGLGHALVSALLYSGIASGLIRSPAPRPSSASAGPLGLGLSQQICRKKRGQALRADFLRVPPGKQTLGLGAGPSRVASPGVP